MCRPSCQKRAPSRPLPGTQVQSQRAGTRVGEAQNGARGQSEFREGRYARVGSKGQRQKRGPRTRNRSAEAETQRPTGDTRDRAAGARGKKRNERSVGPWSAGRLTRAGEAAGGAAGGAGGKRNPQGPTQSRTSRLPKTPPEWTPTDPRPVPSSSASTAVGRVKRTAIIVFFVILKFWARLQGGQVRPPTAAPRAKSMSSPA